MESERNRGSETNLLRLHLPSEWNIDLYLKDEGAHPTGSLKHRLARSLFIYGLCSGKIGRDTVIIEASSGSTAVSEAYFARLLGLSFIAVIPRKTSAEKVRLIEFHGGRCHLVDDSSRLEAESLRLAKELDGHFMDQFATAQYASDWRTGSTLADEIEGQLAVERFGTPTWVVLGAGTGGNSASFGRHIRRKKWDTQLCVVDPEGSAYYPYWASLGADVEPRPGSRIEGIGRPYVESSFVPEVIDQMIQVPDAATIAAMRWGSEVMGRQLGGSTGTNLWGALQIANGMRERAESGSIVTLICDNGDRYVNTYYCDDWLAQHDIDPKPWRAQIDAMVSLRGAVDGV